MERDLHWLIFFGAVNWRWLVAPVSPSLPPPPASYPTYDRRENLPEGGWIGTCKSADPCLFSAKSVDPPTFLFKSETTTTSGNRSIKVQRQTGKCECHCKFRTNTKEGNTLEFQWASLQKEIKLNKLVNLPIKAAERSMTQISFRTQDPNIKTRQAQSGIRAKIHSWSTIQCFQNPRIHPIYRKNPKIRALLRPNPSIRKPIHSPPPWWLIWPICLLTIECIRNISPSTPWECMQVTWYSGMKQKRTEKYMVHTCSCFTRIDKTEIWNF